ncbi:hypothetical protein F-VV57_0010 [Faustovirus]|nr:hypothetical protein F-VV57_0010 [Faustovirus]QJX73277.1 hypothetical protein F-VV63_0011 [Faustovirus]
MNVILMANVVTTMEALPTELIVDMVLMTPTIYCGLVASCRQYRDLLAPLCDRCADSCAREWRRGNHVYYTLGGPDGLKHGCGAHREILYHGRVVDGRPFYEIEWRFGRKHGMERWWGYDGHVISETMWQDGKKHGRDVSYYFNGSIATDIMWENGVHAAGAWYSQDGIIYEAIEKNESHVYR